MRTDIGRRKASRTGDTDEQDCKSIQHRRRDSCTPQPQGGLHFGAALPMTSHESGPVRPWVAPAAGRRAEKVVIDLFYWYVRQPLSRLPDFVAKLMPRWLVYHCAVRLIVHAASDRYGTPFINDVRALEALQRWDDRRPGSAGRAGEHREGS